jgi:hypothetical protein
MRMECDNVLMPRALVGVTAVCCLFFQTFPLAESAPNYDRIRSALQRGSAPARLHVSRASVSAIRPARVKQRGGARRDTVWNGLLIGAGLGAAGGFIWAWNFCGRLDEDCSIVTPLGVLGGAAIGGAIGAIVDTLHR